VQKKGEPGVIHIPATAHGNKESKKRTVVPGVGRSAPGGEEDLEGAGLTLALDRGVQMGATKLNRKITGFTGVLGSWWFQDSGAPAIPESNWPWGKEGCTKKYARGKVCIRATQKKRKEVTGGGVL